MDVQGLLKELRTTVEAARAMPMSSSAVINRHAVLNLIGRLESTLPPDIGRLEEAGGRGASVVGDASKRADQVLSDAHAERTRLVSDSEVYQAAQEEAEALLREAEQEAAELRAETDEYVDSKLANLEISLTKTLDAVTRGRARLHGRSHFDQLGDSATDGSDTT